MAATSSYHHGSLAEEMIRIGLELASDGGPHAVGIREVTRRAGVTPSAAYRHFRDQDEFRQKVAREIDSMMATALEDAFEASTGGPEEKLRALGRAYFDFALSRPQLFAYLNQGFALPNEDSVFHALLRGVRAAEVALTGEPADPERTRERAIALWAAGHGICMLTSTGALKDADEATKRRYMTATMEHAIAGMKAWGRDANAC